MNKQIVSHIYDARARGEVVKQDADFVYVKWDGQAKIIPCLRMELVLQK